MIVLDAFQYCDEKNIFWYSKIYYDDFDVLILRITSLFNKQNYKLKKNILNYKNGVYDIERLRQYYTSLLKKKSAKRNSG